MELELRLGRPTTGYDFRSAVRKAASSMGWSGGDPTHYEQERDEILLSAGKVKELSYLQRLSLPVYGKIPLLPAVEISYRYATADNEAGPIEAVRLKTRFSTKKMSRFFLENLSQRLCGE